jgi:AraC-like DNA-binding protein
MPDTSDVTTIETETYTSRFRPLGPDAMRLYRRQHLPVAHREVEVFGNFWAVSFGTIPEGLVRVRTAAGEIDLGGRGSTFLPPFSLIEWILSPGKFEFEAILCSLPLPESFPKVPVRFEPNEPRLPSSVPGVVGFLEGATHVEPIGLESLGNALALRTKRAIDESFASSVSMAALASSLQTSASVVSRAFRTCFGISPVTYRNRLRVMESWWRLLTSAKPVTEIGYEVGFQDLSRYNKQFRRLIRAVPSQHRAS